MSDQGVIKTCVDCGVISDGREYCADCEVTAVYLYSANQIKAATRPDNKEEPEAA